MSKSILQYAERAQLGFAVKQGVVEIGRIGLDGVMGWGYNWLRESLSVKVSGDL